MRGWCSRELGKGGGILPTPFGPRPICSMGDEALRLRVALPRSRTRCPELPVSGFGHFGVNEERFPIQASSRVQVGPYERVPDCRSVAFRGTLHAVRIASISHFCSLGQCRMVWNRDWYCSVCAWYHWATSNTKAIRITQFGLELQYLSQEALHSRNCQELKDKTGSYR